MASKYSLSGGATACLNMNCASGQTSLKEGSTTATDGCGECALGSYSSGDDNTNCLPQVCPAGYKAAKTGAHTATATDGCEICPAGTFSVGGNATLCSDMCCSLGN